MINNQGSISFDSIITRNPTLTTTALDDELVMLDLERGKYYGLDDIATIIWNFLEIPRTVSEICDSLLAMFEVEPETCRTDTIAFLSEMLQEGLVQYHDPAAA